MRIFVLGAGATGSLLALQMARQGHDVWCGDRDPERARRFLGKNSDIPVETVNARNLRAIVRAARSCHLLVNASPAVFNEIVLRAALHLRSHYLDMAAHFTRHPFRVEQFRFQKKFEQKNRAAVILAGVAPGLTNLLVKRSAEQLDRVESVKVRLYEHTESEKVISHWSPEVSFDEATSRPRIYRDGRFHLAKRFSEREKFRFAPPVGEVPVYLAAQDEVGTLPHLIPMREMDVKIGGGEFEVLRRWYRQGKLSRSRGLMRKRFPATPTPWQMERLVRRGVLANARFAATVLVRGVKSEQRRLLRSDVAFPSLYQIHRQGLPTSPIAWATVQLAALFAKHFPRDEAGVFAPEALPSEIRQAILADARLRGIRITTNMTPLKQIEDEEEY
jgi:hypothetical protein